MSALGFYGKLASRGDFISRNLAPGFIQPWDAWLAKSMQACQQRLGDDWLSAYLVSPLWRFALAAGVCGPNAVVGVLMPSIDKVGRYFPLTVAQTLDPGESIAHLAGDAQEWFETVENLMLSTLDPAVRLGMFEVALSRVPPLAVSTQSHVSDPIGFQVFPACDCQAPQLEPLAVICEGVSLWWGNDGKGVSQGLIRCNGLPDAQRFSSDLLGRGTRI